MIAINASARAVLENGLLARRRAMPLETKIVLAVVLSAFFFFAFILERASRQTQKILREKEKRA
ncbi:hypothetical protein IZ6_07990 [Terrihabitans soli]|uniref:CcmD family protein n=1 Tax=Terrihabitans soli TaxID=708113 RepID=A0A6S6QIK4_9HYPH|nr:hypothetical protein IZ6_07990 [Terrihabitans soli]